MSISACIRLQLCLWMKANVIFVGIMLSAVRDHWCLVTTASVFFLYLYLIGYVYLPFWFVCLFACSLSQSFYFPFSLCAHVCVCWVFVGLVFWLVDFGFSFSFPFPSKRKWNEDKILVSSGIIIKFYKWRDSKPIGAYYF